MERREDVITNSGELAEELYVIEKFPIHMLEDAEDSSMNDVLYDMEFGIHRGSGVIQLIKLIPNDMIYIDTHSNAIGGVWKRHHEAVARIISRYQPQNVLEIGGGTGILENTYNSSADKMTKRWLIIEPEPHPQKTNAEFIKGFFPEALPADYKFDLVVHTHVMEHMYSPYEFMEKIDSVLINGSRMVFSIPNLKVLLEKCKTSILNFEHTIYLAEEYVDWLMAKFNFLIEEKEYFEEHSIIYSVRKVEQCQQHIDLENMYDRNKKLFLSYINHHKSKMGRLNEIMELCDGPLFLFGAHITTQFYMAFGMKTEKIICLLDNDPYKWTKRVGKTDWKIESPKILTKYKYPTVILPSGPYTKEIKEQIITEINENTKFIEVDHL